MAAYVPVPHPGWAGPGVDKKRGERASLGSDYHLGLRLYKGNPVPRWVLYMFLYTANRVIYKAISILESSLPLCRERDFRHGKGRNIDRIQSGANGPDPTARHNYKPARPDCCIRRPVPTYNCIFVCSRVLAGLCRCQLFSRYRGIRNKDSRLLCLCHSKARCFSWLHHVPEGCRCRLGLQVNPRVERKAVLRVCRFYSRHWKWIYPAALLAGMAISRRVLCHVAALRVIQHLYRQIISSHDHEAIFFASRDPPNLQATTDERTTAFQVISNIKCLRQRCAIHLE